MNINIISQYKGLRRENYILCFGRLVTAMGAMVRPMLTMILSQKLGMNAVQVAKGFFYRKLYYVSAWNR